MSALPSTVENAHQPDGVRALKLPKAMPNLPNTSIPLPLTNAPGSIRDPLVMV